jgi:hypothetical protein
VTQAVKYITRARSKSCDAALRHFNYGETLGKSLESGAEFNFARASFHTRPATACLRQIDNVS